jgi:Skp family chaperone for outer membrane proteins
MKQRYKLFLVGGAFAAALQCTVPAPVWAQQQLAAPVVVIIDIQRILRESLAAMSVRGQLEERRTTLRDEFAGLEEELRAAEQALTRQQTVLSDEAFREKRQAYERRVGEAQQKFDASRRELDEAFQQALKEIQVGMSQVAEGLAMEMDADLVLPKSQVMFVNADLDITDHVLKRLDKQLPAVTVAGAGGAAPAPSKQRPNQ